MTGEDILRGLVRVGTVTDTDAARRLARVKFQGEGFTSGWLFVLDNRPGIPAAGVAQATGYTAGGAGEDAFASHAHSLTVTPWMPAVNQTVLCLYLPVFNGDGFILGGII